MDERKLTDEQKRAALDDAAAEAVRQPGNGTKPIALRPYEPKATKKMLLEFRGWKRRLQAIIQKESRIVIQQDGSYEFVLPSKLVRLIWNTTIKERVKLELRNGAEGATKRAMNQLRQEVDSVVVDAAAKVREQQEQKE